MNARRHFGIAAWVALGALVSTAATATAGEVAGATFFWREIEPLFRQHCYECHSHAAGKMKGGLSLDSRSGWAEGGNTGPAIVPGKPDESLLLKAVRHADAELKMPPKQPKLAEADIAKLKRWVVLGAPDPRVNGVANSTVTNWWSLKPLVRPAVPGSRPVTLKSVASKLVISGQVDKPSSSHSLNTVPLITGSRNSSKWVRNPIDAFIAAKLREQKLTCSPEADRRTLIRRLTLDLHGLPPSPEAVATFEKDPDPAAYEQLVDRLLASPRYGERWARHWLDVVHYGESNGFGMDRPRLAAWPYRDYVIAAMNADKPYARFVQEQLAADAIFPEEPALTPALGFAAAGPFNQSALVEQVDGTDCKRSALNLDRDDMVASTASTFLSMTVHCARCHAHKFDPISQTDYYQFQAVFAGVGRTERWFDADPQLRARRAGLRSKIADLEIVADAHPPTEPERAELAAAQVVWEQSLAAQAVNWIPLRVERVTSTNDKTTFSKLDDGSWLASGEAADKDIYTIGTSIRLPKVTALRLEVLPDDRLPTRGPGRQDNGNLHLSEIRVRVVGVGESTVVPLQNASADFNQTDWGIERAIDGKSETAWGIHPQVGKPHQAVFELKTPVLLTQGAALVIELDQLHGQHHLIGRFRLSATDRALPVRVPLLPIDLLAHLARPESERTAAEQKLIFDTHRLEHLRQQLVQLPAEQKVWAIAGDFKPLRNYKPTKEPRPISVLRRGDLKQPLAAVGPGALAAVSTLPSVFTLANPHDEMARRAALAHWITAPENMLAWRSIVNRVWHWHFGRGLVDSPNDFGRMGAPPTHPELLDWLAVEFRDSGGSFKRLHKLIVTSAAYRQVSTYRAAAARVDGDNRFLWRMNRPRLDAENLRDSLLAASGKLDLTLGGPSAMQFKFDDPNQEVSPRLDYAAFDPDSPASYRRSVYRFLFRNVNDPLLEAFDAVDPSLSTPRRDSTITPLQALSLWNNRFVLRQCEHLAARLEREAGTLESQVERAAQWLHGRRLTRAETAWLTDHARRHGLANVCRVLVNSNEFLFVN